MTDFEARARARIRAYDLLSALCDEATQEVVHGSDALHDLELADGFPDLLDDFNDKYCSTILMSEVSERLVRLRDENLISRELRDYLRYLLHLVNDNNFHNINFK